MTGTAPGAWKAVVGGLFVCSWGGNQFSPLLVMYEQHNHYSAVLVNLFLGVYVVGLAPALLIAGSLSDRHGRKRVLLVSLVSAVVGSSLLALGVLGPEFLILGRLFAGVTVGSSMAVGVSWIKELSGPPYDLRADAASGARRGTLAFSLGSAVGALVAGCLAQWGPIPEVLPFLVHIAVTIPFLIVVARAPETSTRGGVAGPWWRQLRIPSASHKRFVRVVLVSAPWIFAAAGVGYGYLPVLLRPVTGQWSLIYATTLTVVALAVAAVIQPWAKRLDSESNARGLLASVLFLLGGFALVWLAVATGNILVGVGANVVLGIGLGIGMVSGLLEVQRIAGTRDLAGLTGVFYAAAYLGFLTPTVMSAFASFLPLSLLFGILLVLVATSAVLVLVSYRAHLPAG